MYCALVEYGEQVTAVVSRTALGLHRNIAKLLLKKKLRLGEYRVRGATPAEVKAVVAERLEWVRIRQQQLKEHGEGLSWFQSTQSQRLFDGLADRMERIVSDRLSPRDLGQDKAQAARQARIRRRRQRIRAAQRVGQRQIYTPGSDCRAADHSTCRPRLARDSKPAAVE